MLNIGKKNYELIKKEKIKKKVKIGDLFEEMMVEEMKEILENKKEEIGVKNLKRNF
jgi:hypothetical protein